MTSLNVHVEAGPRGKQKQCYQKIFVTKICFFHRITNDNIDNDLRWVMIIDWLMSQLSESKGVEKSVCFQYCIVFNLLV